MICPICRKHFCPLKAFNDYQTNWYREFFGHTPTQRIQIPENVIEVTCPNCKHDVKIKEV